MTGFGAEGTAVQFPLIRYAEEAGWTHIDRDEALRLRQGEQGPLLFDVLVRQLQRLNPGIVGEAQAIDIARRLTRLRPDINGNLEAWEYLTGKKQVFLEAEARELNFRLLDMDSLDANTFHVTEEFQFDNGSRKIRPDVVFLINGFPVLLAETKSAKKQDAIAEALGDIRVYHERCPELLCLNQLFNLTNLVQYYYGATWATSRKGVLNWRDDMANGDFETLVKTFIAPRRLLRVLSEHILFARKHGELTKVVLRPHQMRAIDKVVLRCGDAGKRRGLIWHTQGSGKTYTMLSVARHLIEDPALDHPTVLMLIDRTELEAQLDRNLAEVGFGHYSVAESKRDLQEQLRSDTRGLIVSMIHKFDDIDADINTRSNIYVLVDEAHRTTGGTLGNYLMGALPNATYIGFTGTPIDLTAYGKGTFKTFGVDDPPKGYLDKYSIRESIEDGTTVRLHYALAPNDLLVDRDVLEAEFLSLAEAQGVSDIDELNRILDKAVTLRTMLKNQARVEKVARYIAEHFRENVEPSGYKAFVVGVDREACVLLKEALDKHLPPEYSQVVISQNPKKDSDRLQRYYLADSEEKRVRREYIDADKLPKILVVTEKLLTGFDAPVLYCMYLDKPMRDHVLLQAISRVNRPYEDRQGKAKPAGMVIDFVGIFTKLQKALAFDSEDVIGVIDDIDVIRQRFEQLLADGRSRFIPLASGKSRDKAVEAFLEHFRDQEPRAEFYTYFKELQDIYEILSPDPFLRQYLKEYELLADMYLQLRAAYERQLVDLELMRKTAQLVREYTQTSPIRALSRQVVINEELLDKLAGEDKPDVVKVFNLLMTLDQAVQQRQAADPYLIAIGERAESIAKAFEERQLTTQEAIDELRKLVDEYKAAAHERQASDLSAEAFAVKVVLDRDEVQQTELVARAADEAFKSYPHWQYSGEHERQVRLRLYKALKDAGVAEPIPLAQKVLQLLKRAR